MTAMRIILLPILAACLLGACGGDDKGAPGSESNPLVGLPNPSATRVPAREQPPGESGARAGSGAAPSGARSSGLASHGTKTQRGSAAAKAAPSKGSRKQSTTAPSARRPCSLVSRAQARTIIGAAILEPLQAPQGPTCIYQAKSGKAYVTLAVQQVDFAKLRKQIGRTRAVSVADHTAYCGTYGTPMLFLPVGGGRVLSISAPCRMAQQFAAKAALHL